MISQLGKYPRSLDGVFVLREADAPASLVQAREDDGAHIMVNHNMETNVKGVYAAGDCTGRPYQITKATGEGNIAAHSIIEYLREIEK
ncbi:MAG: NAD(P)/FAD-dependent oxidoreductase [Eggerthellaceae bacterium]|nr:NAD(P)/FAD-dependent oxidoreductase [Eggerthellaceae bacterium]